MSYLFQDATTFNDEISNWSTVAVENMERMFSRAAAFSQPLNDWDVSSATNMFQMFFEASSFAQQLCWDLKDANVDTIEMFCGSAGSFAETCATPESITVDVAQRSASQNCLIRLAAFTGRTPLKEAVDAWIIGDREGVISLYGDISDWDTTLVTDMSYLFYLETTFNEPISNWNTGAVENMEGMFLGASTFNQPLNGWDVSKVDSMSSMFATASSFNQPLGAWDVTSVDEMGGMFAFASNFNQFLSFWDVSSVIGMEGMFVETTAFTQARNLCWDLSGRAKTNSMFCGSPGSFGTPTRCATIGGQSVTVTDPQRSASKSGCSQN
jgi:surface protein